MTTRTFSALASTTAPLVYRKKVILAKFGISETTLRRWMQEENFPRPRQLGPRAVGWLESQVNEWLQNRPVVNSNALEDDD